MNKCPDCNVNIFTAVHQRWEVAGEYPEEFLFKCGNCGVYLKVTVYPEPVFNIQRFYKKDNKNEKSSSL